MCHLFCVPNTIAQMYQVNLAEKSHTAQICLGYVSIRPGNVLETGLRDSQESPPRGPVGRPIIVGRIKNERERLAA